MNATFTLVPVARSKPALLLLLVLLPCLLPAQITFMRTYGGYADDDALSVQQTRDSGYIMAGWTDSYGARDRDIWLIKTDSLGDTVWTREFGGTDYDGASSVRQTRDGGYVVACFIHSYAGSDAWLIKTDSIGDTLWTRTLGGASSDWACSVQQTVDGGYAIAGHTKSYGAGRDDAWLLKTDTLGDTLWTRTFGGADDDCAYSVQQTADRGYVLAGETRSFGAGNTDAWLIKTDSLGNLSWTSTYGDTDDDFAECARQTTDGGYIVAGRTFSHGAGQTDAWLLKTDSLGDTLWTRTYGGEGFDWAYSVQQTEDRGYVLAGWTCSRGVGAGDFWLIKTDSLGDTLWTRTFGGAGQDWAWSVQQTADRGYVLAGWTDSFGAGESDVWLIKTDSLGNVGVEEPREPTAYGSRLTASPNPCRGVAIVRTPFASRPSPLSLRVMDVSGRTLQSAICNLQSEIRLDLRGQPPGVYTLRLGSATQRLVVQR